MRLVEASELSIDDIVLRRCSSVGIIDHIEWPHDVPGVLAVSFVGDQWSRDWYHPTNLVALIEGALERGE